MHSASHDVENGFSKASISTDAEKHSPSSADNSLSFDNKSNLKASLSKAFLSKGMPVTFKVWLLKIKIMSQAKLYTRTLSQSSISPRPVTDPLNLN